MPTLLLTINYYSTIAALFILAFSVLACGVILVKSNREQVKIRIAYLGYGVCAMVVGVFQLNLYVEGPELFMMFIFYLVPIVLFGVLAFVMTILEQTNIMLWILAGSTILLGIFQLLVEYVRMGMLMNVTAYVYVSLVFATITYRQADWLSKR